jgi:abortive infection bacteriophage resistance protein
MEVKPPKTYAEQVSIWKSRGCAIANEAVAENFLSSVNYYRLAGYFLPFKNANDTYVEGTSFERVSAIYSFDNKLRAVLWAAIGNAEIAARTIIAYHIAHKFGALGYMNRDTFKKNYDHNIFSKEFADAVRHNHSLLFVQHHQKEYEGKFPIWVAVELFTMGMTSKMYFNLKWGDQRRIANQYNLLPEELQSSLYCLTLLRNSCAHYDRLYATRFKARPRFPLDFPAKADSSLFSMICVLKLLNRDKDEWNNSTLRELSALIDQYRDHLSFAHIGFPDNWETVLRW